MAFKTVGSGSYDEIKKGTGMTVGEVFEGYLTKIDTRPGSDGKPMHSLFFNVGGKNILFSPAGNIKYLIEDEKLEIGVKTRITRKADKLVGKTMKKMSSQFEVLQDNEDTFNPALAKLEQGLGQSPVANVKTSIPKLTKTVG